MDYTNTSELIDAVETGNLKKVHEMVKGGIDVNFLLPSGISLLSRVVQIQNTNLIDEILKASSSNNLDDYDVNKYFNTHWMEEIIQPVYCYHLQLCRSGCNVNIVDKDDKSPLHHAAQTGNVEIMEILVKAGSVVNVSDKNNLTPLHSAVISDNMQAVEYLLDHGARIDSMSVCKRTPFHIAIANSLVPIAELLLKRGANFHLSDADNITPLFTAVDRRLYELVNTLLQSGANPNHAIQGHSPLSLAVQKKDLRSVKMLLAYNAKIRNLTLHIAVSHGSLEIAKLLVARGAPVGILDLGYQSVVHLAVKTGNIDMLRMLLMNGHDANVREGISGKYPLHIAIENESLSEENFSNILGILISFNARINDSTHSHGNTPLYSALAMRRFAFAEELLRQGCDPQSGFVPTSNNIRTIDLAISENNLRLVEMLVYAGYCINNNLRCDMISLKTKCPDIYNFLHGVKNKPMSLRNLCRIAYRRSLGRNVLLNISKLRKPFSSLADFLAFRGVEKY